MEMAKSRSCHAASVCYNDEFLSMSDKAKLLYLLLGFEVNSIGEIVGARRIARGLGSGEDALQELAGCGFIIEAGGRVFDRHHFENNTLSNQGMKASAGNEFSKVAGLIEFEGEEFKSAYRLANHELGENKANDSRNIAIKREVNETKTKHKERGNPNPNPNTRKGETEPPRAIGTSCPVCGGNCTAARELTGRMHAACALHGDFWYDPCTGEYYDNPF